MKSCTSDLKRVNNDAVICSNYKLEKYTLNIIMLQENLKQENKGLVLFSIVYLYFYDKLNS